MTYDFLTTKYRDGQVVGTGSFPEFIRFIPSLEKVAIIRPDTDGTGYKVRTAENLADVLANGLDQFPASFYGLVITNSEATTLGVPFLEGDGGGDEMTVGYKLINDSLYLSIFGVALGTYLANSGTPRRAVALAALRGQDFARPAAPAAPAAPTTGQAIANALKQVFKI